MTNDLNLPLVSVIIPCYNQGRFLSKSIQSVRDQTYPNIEIIVINDGSTDETQQLASSFQGILLVSQENQGLPGARNRGIRESSGKYLAFLDADDWFYPEAIERNVKFLEADPSLAFVSGNHSVFYEETHEIKNEPGETIDKDNYIAMLQRNYIGNPATVLYTKWIMHLYPFDNSAKIKGCEDYDHYLKITRKYPVLHHEAHISYYRKHGNNMSENYPMMLESVLYALNRQAPFLNDEAEKKAYTYGLQRWKWMYLNMIYRRIYARGFKEIPGLTKNFVWKYRMSFVAFFLKNITVKIHLLFIKLGLKDG